MGVKVGMSGNLVLEVDDDALVCKGVVVRFFSLPDALSSVGPIIDDSVDLDFKLYEGEGVVYLTVLVVGGTVSTLVLAVEVVLLSEVTAVVVELRVLPKVEDSKAFGVVVGAVDDT